MVAAARRSRVSNMAAPQDVHVRICNQEIVKFDLEVKALIQVHILRLLSGSRWPPWHPEYSRPVQLPSPSPGWLLKHLSVCSPRSLTFRAFLWRTVGFPPTPRGTLTCRFRPLDCRGHGLARSPAASAVAPPRPCPPPTPHFPEFGTGRAPDATWPGSPCPKLTNLTGTWL